MASHAARTTWTFLTNHAHALLVIARNPEATLREIGGAVGITERAAFMIVEDLAVHGYITKQKVGRRNRYNVDPARPFRHPLEQHECVGALLQLIAPLTADRPDAAAVGADAAS